MDNNSKFLSLDVENVGLHKPTTSWGAILIDRSGTELGSWQRCLNARDWYSGDENWAWYEKNIHPYQKISDCYDPEDLHREFWDLWINLRKQCNPILVADCPWPCESRFLNDVVAYFDVQMEYLPYPILDVASVRFSAGLDPIGSEGRMNNELPIHNPLADARQSARLLLEALNIIESVHVMPER